MSTVRHSCYGPDCALTPMGERCTVPDCPRERLLALFTSAPKAFWRCDVDFSLAAAERMARFAQVAGVTVTFYLAPRSVEYNIFSPEGERTIASILKCGHRLGAHVDSTGRLPEVAAGRDLSLLDEGYRGVFTERLVSFHMPDVDVLWRDFPGFENAYAARWEGRYLSDSRGEWAEEKQAQVTEQHQVALHAEHWFGA